MTHASLKALSLSHHYGGETLFAGVDLVLNPGDRIGLVGPNGVGKTTLLRILSGDYAQDAEELLDAYLFGPDQWQARLSDLSAGELRRLLLAVLVNSPTRVLVPDDPTNYLDFDALDVIEEALRAYRGTLVMVTHDRYFAERVGITRRWHLADGRFTQDPARPAGVGAGDGAGSGPREVIRA